MKVTEILREQHTEVRALFKKITANGHTARERSALVDQLIAALQVHTRLEETIFYPALRELDTKKAEETVLESYEEHNIVDFLMAQLPQMDPTSERFLARVRVLQSLVDEHVTEEEEEMFKQAEKLGADELETLGEQMRTQIEEIARVNALVERAATLAERGERIAGRWLDLSLGLPRRIASALAPSRLLRLDRRAMWVVAIAASVPKWIVDGAYDLWVGPSVSPRERRSMTEVGRRFGVSGDIAA